MRLLQCRIRRIDARRRGRSLDRFSWFRRGNAPAASIPELLIALKACGIAREVQSGRKIHWDSVRGGHGSAIRVANTLISMYARCGSIVEAKRVFDGMQEPDTVSWNALIQGYATSGEENRALQLFFHARGSGLADSRTHVFALMACSTMAEKEDFTYIDGRFLKVKSLRLGLTVHSHARDLVCDADIFVAGTLVDMYSKCGSMENAISVFESMVNPDVVLWTALILGFAENGQADVALELFQRMQREGCEPNARTFVAALVACVETTLEHRGKQGEKVVKANCLEIGKSFHSQAARRGLDSELFVASSLIDMYSKCGSVGEAWKAFNGIKRHDVVSWTTMILGYAENGDGKSALELFELMQARGCSPNTQTYLAALLACTAIVSSTDERSDTEMKLLKSECLEKAMGIHSRALQTDIFVENALLDLYAKCGSMLDARKVFDRMKCYNVVSWSALIHGYAQDEHECKLASGIFAAMKNSGGCLPDAQVYVAVLVACSNAADLETGKILHAEICKQGHESNEFVGNCLVDFYGRTGRVEKAEQVFDSMRSRDLVSWSSLVAGFSRLGDATRVFQLFSEMREAGVQANAVTFQSLLSACSHAGLVEKGKKCFESMELEYGIKPGIEHYQCMIDLLGRAGHLDEALAMVKTMPFEANVVTWTAVLGACEKWKNVEIGRAAFNSLLELDEQRGAAYALMANLHERWNVGARDSKRSTQLM